ncbi:MULTISPECIES: SPFH domain-containing protein [Uliginosibacterium]|uniref:SPFH domain-containing protein n=1 Tax=Uliginosibacterium aquaticum TaxID=2731212 RepID=A0ABX2IPG4_9RHOO|nr:MULTISPECIES: SPFH domain-containing protein [Uliginosibacterium]MDO6388194.1 SPFH domain-containing protein [Uliginosibacterium sp. 31-12]NSL55885.1 SPFH domain-containing protein [Uliginosibacterium aquaticum]PLK50649.1 membrane protease subunit, stomatin/prohibitin [Uliginosibacterium sp. TH139]
MFGIRFIKVGPTDFLLQYKSGKVVREGVGLSFFYYGPTSSLVRVPVGSVDVPFIFEEATADFQSVTVQGQLSYRVTDPRKLAQLMNFTLAANGRDYASEDPQKLPQRLINHAQVLTSSSLRVMSLREALGGADRLVGSVRVGMQAADVITSLGIEVLGLSILAIKPTPETSRALEAEAREAILRQADEAVFARRNAAVEQERSIKENELNTEIAVENKKRQIKEAQMDAEKSVQQKKRELREAEMATKIALEEQNKDLLALSTANTREEADAKAYGISAMMRALSETDPKVLQALTSARLDAAQLVALSFKELAENAGKIGELNISSELLQGLLERERN